jgi:hypothetical protein
MNKIEAIKSMTRQDQINKFLTEQMGECWHDRMVPSDGGVRCYKCKAWFTSRYIDRFNSGEYNTNFFTWVGFGKLWEWAQAQEWWTNFGDWFYSIDSWHKAQDFKLCHAEYLIHPDSFANAVYEFLKERE